MGLRVGVVVDYQNVHLSARDAFVGDRQPAELALINPVLLGKELVARKEAQRRADSDPGFELAGMEVYRGLPDPSVDPDGYRRNLAQREAWQKTAAVYGIPLRVTYRPLKYHFYYEDGQRLRNPDIPPQEKGVDVLCALALTRMARDGEYDVVVLASRDTDLIPALEEANMEGGVKVESVKWYDHDAPWTRGNLKPDFRMWTTSLDRASFERSRDKNDYK